VIVIDGGNEKDSTKLEKYIKHLGGAVDTWLFTHLHYGHIGAALVLAEKDIPVGRYVFDVPTAEWFENNRSLLQHEKESAKRFFDTITDKNSVAVRKNMTLKIDNLLIQVLTDCSDCDGFTDMNEMSVVYRVEFAQKSVLFLGDLGREKSALLAKEYGKRLKSDILQVAHHGKDGLDMQIGRLVQPEICIWTTADSCWEKDKAVKELNIKTNINYKDGDICII
jgi:beta-lactamase superfamily II metal-dependent hydrolase